MFEWRCLPKWKKDSIIREYMRQEEEKDFKEYARRKYNIFFTENDIELYLYEFEEKPQEEIKVKEKINRKKLSEMTDAELKEYYRQKEEEKQRRIRVQEELKAEEEHRKEETRRRLEAEYYEAHREEIKTKKRAETERAKEYAKQGNRRIFWMGIVLTIILIWIFATSGVEDIGTGIAMWIVLLVCMTPVAIGPFMIIGAMREKKDIEEL